MIKAQIVPATADHIEAMLPHVRQADVEEFLATNGWSPRRVLETGLRTSTFCCAGLVNGEVATIFGVAPASMIGGSGIPWLVGTDALEKYQRTFLRRCGKVVNAMLTVYPYLENYVDARNHVARVWLNWLGFTIEEPKPYGIQRLPFHRFHMERK
ncbi:hypothetical protein [Citrobacter freundii]|uniref:hypothetical protein n=1 Tax=Citrobacter freundii TaxID=546 RepID=UPI003AAB162B|nr:hypothetical protein [Escherichia coli]EIO6539933.1 hypothetical protein [Escherichia coli]EIO6556508.1 hypothetical protein [Escherichia coli]